jgi:hypothetical protein
MKTKHEAVIDCLMAVASNESRENANAYAAHVWEKYFSHIDFIMWNGTIPDQTASRLAEEAKNRAPLHEEDVASLREFLGAYRNQES